jgi:hypothetical protein
MSIGCNGNAGLIYEELCTSAADRFTEMPFAVTLYAAQLSTLLNDKRREPSIYVFADTAVFGTSVTGRRFICSMTSPAIILRSSCS